MASAALRLAGQLSRGPNGVTAQSTASITVATEPRERAAMPRDKPPHRLFPGVPTVKRPAEVGNNTTHGGVDRSRSRHLEELSAAQRPVACRSAGVLRGLRHRAAGHRGCRDRRLLPRTVIIRRSTPSTRRCRRPAARRCDKSSRRRFHNRARVSSLRSFGWVLFVVAAIGLFSSLQFALNAAWDLELQRRGFWKTIQERALNFCMMLVAALLLMLSVIFNALLNGFSAWGWQLTAQRSRISRKAWISWFRSWSSGCSLRCCSSICRIRASHGATCGSAPALPRCSSL